MLKRLAVIIKSSRRPWALERLLGSLGQHLKSIEFPDVTIVDDRTDPQHLKLLQERFPWVRFGDPSDWSVSHKSSTLPYVEAWRRAVSSCNEPYVLILEDDQWLCQDLDLDEALRAIEFNSALSLNMSSGLKDLSAVESFVLNNSPYVGILPKTLSDRNLASLIRSPFVKMVTAPTPLPRKVSAGLMLIWPSLFRQLWRSLASVNPMAGVIYDKNHWLHLWSGQIPWINENLMISRTISRLRESGFPRNAVLQSNENLFKTSFVSTASLTLGTGVDWPAINNEISQIWYSGQLQIPESCVDWDAGIFAQIISASLGTTMSAEYIDWCGKFQRLHKAS